MTQNDEKPVDALPASQAASASELAAGLMKSVP